MIWGTGDVWGWSDGTAGCWGGDTCDLYHRYKRFLWENLTVKKGEGAATEESSWNRSGGPTALGVSEAHQSLLSPVFSPVALWVFQASRQTQAPVWSSGS